LPEINVTFIWFALFEVASADAFERSCLLEWRADAPGGVES